MNTESTVLLTRDKLRLRRFCQNDVQSIIDLNKDDRVTQSLVEGKLLSHPSCAEFFVNDVLEQYVQNPTLGSWIAEKRNNNNHWDFQGWFNLSPVPEGAFAQQVEKLPLEKQPTNTMIELGSRLATVAWGSHLSLQIGEHLLRYAFLGLQLPKVVIHCVPKNRSAVYCALHLGFEQPQTVKYTQIGRECLSRKSGGRRSHT